MSDEQQERVTCGDAGGKPGCRGAWVPGNGIWTVYECNLMKRGMVLAVRDGNVQSTTGYCPECGAKLSFDSEGNPVAAAQVAKAALELAVENLLEDPLPWRNGRGKDISNENIVKHFVAEAAAKEAPDGSK